MWKQLPNLYLNNSITVNHVPIAAARQPAEEERGYESTQIPPVDEIDERNRFDRWSLDSRPMSKNYIMKMIFKYGVLESNNNCTNISARIQCFDCKRWFESENIKTSHTCISAAVTGASRRTNIWLKNENDNTSNNR